MKWFLMLLVFVGGIYFLYTNDKAEKKKEELKQSQLKAAEDPELPVKPEKVYVMRFSAQTLKTLRSLSGDANEKVRFAVVELLWQLQDEQAPSIIKRMLQEETDPAVKKSIVDMLARDKSKLSLALLSEALNDYDKETRIKVVNAIGTFCNKEAIVVLNKALQDYDEEVRLKAVEAVNTIRRDIEANKEQKLQELQVKPIFRVQ